MEDGDRLLRSVPDARNDELSIPKGHTGQLCLGKYSRPPLLPGGIQDKQRIAVVCSNAKGKQSIGAGAPASSQRAASALFPENLPRGSNPNKASASIGSEDPPMLCEQRKVWTPAVCQSREERLPPEELPVKGESGKGAITAEKVERP